MAKSKQTEKRTNTKDAKGIRIRMYRVGFGDCFLLSLPVGPPGSEEYRHFVIDCGVHGKGNIGTIGKAVENIGQVTGGKLAAVIATHSHQDHISGFSEKFSEFEIGEVWLPWCENKNDELANKWRKKQSKLAADLVGHFAAQAKLGLKEAESKERQKSLAALVNLTSSEESMRLLIGGSPREQAEALASFAKLTSNAKAIDLLNNGFNVGAKVKYYEAGQVLTDAVGIPGLEIRVLGPPRDQKFLSKMDPPLDQEYLRIDSNGAIETTNKLRPFSPKWIVDYALAKTAPPLAPDEAKKMADQIANVSLDALAFTLDSAKNNTSLVTLFIYRGEYLLFPGDAQYGNWKYWLEGKDSGDILSKLSFLKVGHHGSHNATPKAVVEGLTHGKASAMVATQCEPWDVIPRPPLMAALNAKTDRRMVRSDWIAVPGAPAPLANAEPPQPATIPAGFTQDKFWFDCEL